MPVRNIPPSVVDIITELAQAVPSTEIGTDSRRWHKKMLSTAIRHIEYFITPRVSQLACETALKYDIKDLSSIPWRPPSAWAPGKDLIFEHAYPASDLVRKILSFQNPSYSDIELELYKAEIVWIHRDENIKLKRNNRECWRTEYANAGIHLVSES
jgi:hypothetical protein